MLIDSPKKYLVDTYCVPGSVPGSRYKQDNTAESLPLWGNQHPFIL